MKSIFLVEKEINVRDALCLIIEHQSDLQIIGTADQTSCILAEVCKQQPDVVLLDWYLPGICIERLFQAIRRCCRSVTIIAMSVRPENENNAIKAGADAFLLKQLAPDQFIDALKAAIEKKENNTK